MTHPVLRHVRGRTGPLLVDTLRSRLDAVLRGAGFHGSLRLLAWLAVDEAAVNIEEHGYRGRTGMPLWATARRTSPGRVTVALFDRAPVPYPVREPVENLASLALSRASRGRGRALIREIAAELHHRPRRGGGNTLVLVLDRDRLQQSLEENRSDAA